MTDNCILVDWFSATTTIYSPVTLIDYLGLDINSFTDLHGFYGYADRLYFGGISIHYNQRGNDSDKPSVLLEMSGKGCRQFETSSNRTFYDLFDDVLNGEFNITRLDVAYDDIDKNGGTGLLDIKKIARFTLHQRFVSKWGSGHILDSFEVNGNCEPMTHALTIQFGSTKSDIMLRIYDKAQERGGLDYHWVRAEIVLRRERALDFIKNLCTHKMPLGKLYSGVLKNYLRFIRMDHSRRERCTVIGWWDSFLNHADKIKIFTKKEVDYNLSNVCRYVLEQAGNSISVFLSCYGVEELLNQLHKRKSQLNTNQRRLIADFLENHPDCYDDVKETMNILNNPEVLNDLL